MYRVRADGTEAEIREARLKDKISYAKRKANRTEAQVESDKAKRRQYLEKRRERKGPPHIVTPPGPLRPALPRSSSSASAREKKTT